MALNEAEYLLTCLAEEGLEVAHRMTKALRFGLDEVQQGQPYTNRERILLESIDFISVLEVLVDRGVLDIDLVNESGNLTAAKKAKIVKYLDYAKSIGAVK